ncbi:MAG TPA: efflux RND transporter periplasmic adaptor subunit [Terriglobales bacterium]|jgi:HlyD family secretion protein|nr:efflux RND transporter periplasmic adaptor subunit [Terriglobales bacterium]
MQRRIPILILLVAVLAAGYYFYLRPRWADKETNGKLLKVSGNIETHESVVGFKVQGRIVELPIEEGQWVERGALLAKLDSDDYRQQVAMDEAALRVQRRQLDLGLAGTRQQELQATEQVLLDAKADLEQKKLDFKRADTLFKQEVGSQQARDQAETNLKRAQAAVDRAQQQYDEAVEGTRREQLDINRANVVQAEQKLRMSRINLEYATLTAPKSGVVLVRQAELGEVVAPNTPVVTLGDLDDVWLRAYVSETDLGRIRWGQPAVIRTDTYPGKTYRGRISFISSKAEFTPKSVQTFKERVTLVYRIKIDVENPNHELKPGMPADAEIELASATQAARQ